MNASRSPSIIPDPGRGGDDVRLSRRLLLKRGAALGLSLPAVTGLLAACGNGGGQSASDSAGPEQSGATGGAVQQWRIGTPAFKADSMFQNLGIGLGFFEEEGIEAEIVPLESSATITRAVLSGELEAGSGGAGSPIIAIAEGAEMKLIGSVFAKVPHLMYVREDIGSLEDLMGQNVGGAQPGALLQQLAYASFIEADLDPDGVDYVNTGGSPDTFQAVVAGTVQAGVAGSEYALLLEEDPSIPVKALFPIAERLPQFLRNADFVSTRLLSENRDLVLRASKAYVRGARYAVENKEEAVAWAVENAGVDEETAAAVWEEYVNDDLVNVEYAIAPQQLEYTQEINILTGSQTDVMPFDDVVEPEIAQTVQEQL